MSLSPARAAAAALTIGTLALAGCSTAAADGGEDGNPSGATVQIEDNEGTKTVPVEPISVVATDNRLFETLAAFGVSLAAAPVALMPPTSPYREDSEIADLGTHNEPNLEAVIAAEPDLVINGQRFAQFQEDITGLVPDAPVVLLDPRDGEPFDGELRRQVTVLGQIFAKEDEAAALVEAFDGAIARASAAYDPAETVMAVIVSGGEIGYVAPGLGRTLGPVFDMLGLTPALEVDESSDDHQGDDISVEAIAAANPDWILVLDRDAAVSADDPAYEPAAEILVNSQALASVTAVAEDQIVYMPADTYTNEGIQTYTEFLNDLADALEGGA